MSVNQLLHKHLSNVCTGVHSTRLQSIMDVSYGLQKSQNVSLTAMGRKIDNNILVKHKIKKVDRLEGNKHLHKELESIYSGLSSYIFSYLSHDSSIPIIIDLCYIKDDCNVQMLSAEVAMKGRSIPLYRDVFEKKGLKNRAKQFLLNLSECIPKGKKILIIMDAAFGEDWFKEIETYGWYWLVRIRQGKKVKLNSSSDWISVTNFIPEIGRIAKSYNNAFIIAKHNRPCRIITKKNISKNTRKKPKKLPRNYNSANGGYSRSAKEPWILATNLPSEYNTTKVVNYYSKRMQIEESFRDAKSHQFGLSARYARTSCINRWGVKMLLVAIVQVVLWIIGIVGYNQNLQKKFQANTVKNKKVFSYFYLGQLIVEHNMIKDLKINYKKLSSIIEQELARKW
jgi:hypothetical protein